MCVIWKIGKATNNNWHWSRLYLQNIERHLHFIPKPLLGGLLRGAFRRAWHRRRRWTGAWDDLILQRVMGQRCQVSFWWVTVAVSTFGQSLWEVFMILHKSSMSKKSLWRAFLPFNLRTHRIQNLVSFQVVRLQAPCQRLSRFGDDMCGPKQEPQTMRNAKDTQILLHQYINTYIYIFNIPYIVMICILHTVIIAWNDYIHIMNVYTFDIPILYIVWTCVQYTFINLDTSQFKKWSKADKLEAHSKRFQMRKQLGKERQLWVQTVEAVKALWKCLSPKLKILEIARQVCETVRPKNPKRNGGCRMIMNE